MSGGVRGGGLPPPPTRFLQLRRVAAVAGVAAERGVAVIFGGWRRGNICYFDSAARPARPAIGERGHSISPVIAGHLEFGRRLAGWGAISGIRHTRHTRPYGIAGEYDYAVGKVAVEHPGAAVRLPVRSFTAGVVIG
jgi:hypothetical protein